MDRGQFAVYQLKNIPENRELRFRPYKELLEKGIRISISSYGKVYEGRLEASDSPDNIRIRLQRKLPRTFSGHSLSVSDVFVLNRDDAITSYYLEKQGFSILPDFFRKSSAGTLINIDTADYRIEGKEGMWLAYDSIVVGGREFFLMERTDSGFSDPRVVLDETGRIAVDDVHNGFDDVVRAKISQIVGEKESSRPQPEQKVSLENWQKAYENGEYLRSAEISGEQNYNMIDGLMNNLPAKPRVIGKRISVLDRLHLKQARISAKRNRPELQAAEEQEMERKQT